MRISVNTGTLLKYYSMEEAMTVIKNAGFDSADFSVQSVLGRPEFSEENFEKSAYKLREHSEKIGLPLTQAHSGGDVVRSIKIASICGIETIIVHPRIIVPHVGHEDENFKLNMEFYSKYVDVAREYNVKIGVENMFKWCWNREFIQHSTCSRPEEFVRYMDELNRLYGDVFTACLDIGHVALVSVEPADAIRALGSRLTGLHVHDNFLISDDHTLPGIGKIDFNAVSDALRDIKYTGEYTLECAFNQPKELIPLTLEYVANVCRHYAARAQW